MEQVSVFLLGAVASYLQGKGSKLAKKYKLLISIGSCLLVALVVEAYTVYLGGAFSPEVIFEHVVEAFAASQLFYVTYFKLLKNGNK